ncbi:MAG: family 2 glycosyl transferase [Bacteroidetes bacterium OLB9]|nr:MAG: family 2 glycosyl transferase [Bacteroidetes bacterium OLB9]
MLSIVIPIYNQDVRKLVDTLMKQCQKLDINFQILCFDDCSEPKYRKLNKELAFRINVNYTEMAENLGRSRIRNWLGKAAYFDNILFLDGDTVIKNRNFIKTYVDYLPTEHILCGGRNYSLKPPRSKKKLLHWRYGSKRESLPSKKRNKDPYINFHSNNFIIPEKLFKDHLFDENVKGYGYEDLLYAFDLKKSGVNIVHIDNPTLHDGLEVNTMFIKKTKNAIENLAMLYKQKKNSTHSTDQKL